VFLVNQEVESSRRIRSDKKRAVSPYISLLHQDKIKKLSYITDLPKKTIGEVLIQEALKSNKVMSDIRVFFRREFAKDPDHLYLGDLSRKPYKLMFGVDKNRLPMRFLATDYNNLAALAYALDCSVSTAAALLLKIALKQNDLYILLGQAILKSMDKEEIQDIRMLCRILDKSSPEHYITVPLIISHAIELGMSKSERISSIILKWLQKS